MSFELQYHILLLQEPLQKRRTAEDPCPVHAYYQDAPDYCPSQLADRYSIHDWDVMQSISTWASCLEAPVS